MADRVTRVLDSITQMGKRVSLVGLFAIFTIGLVGLGVGRPGDLRAENVAAQEQDRRRAEEEIIASRPYEPMTQVAGIVVNEKDEPVKSASVAVRFWERMYSFKSNSKGKFKFDVPKSIIPNMLIFASSPDRTLQTSQRVDWEPTPEDYQSLKLKLLPARSFVVTVKDQKGQVVPDAKVGCINGYSPFAISTVDKNGRVTMTTPKNLDVEFLFAISKSTGADYKNGTATFAWIPDWPQHLTFYSVSTDYTAESITIKPDSAKRDIEIEVLKEVKVRGSVKLPNGDSAIGLSVRLHGQGARAGQSRGPHSAASFYTNDEGRFELNLAPHQAYLGFTQDKILKFKSPFVFVVGDTYEGDEFDLTVGPGIKIFGKVSIKGSKKPVPNQTVFVLQSAKEKIPIDGDDEGIFLSTPGINRSVKTNENGEFELLAGAGKYTLRGPIQKETIETTITDQKELEFNFELDRLPVGTLTGIVSDTSGKTLSGVEIVGLYAPSSSGIPFKALTNKKGEFAVEREMVRTVIRAKTKDGKLARIIEIGPDDTTIKIELNATIEATGRLVDAAGDSLPNKKIMLGQKVYLGKRGGAFTTLYGDAIKTDKNGNFKLDQLVPGTAYNLILVTREEDAKERERWSHLLEVNPKADQTTLELGDVPHKR